MGALAAAFPVIGIIAGIIIAKLTPYEQKQGKKHFILLQHLTLACIISIILLRFGNIVGIISGIAAFLILWKTDFPHFTWMTPILAIPSALVINTQIPIFLYFIPTGTMSRNIKKTLLAAVAYVIIAVMAA